MQAHKVFLHQKTLYARTFKVLGQWLQDKGYPSGSIHWACLQKKRKKIIASVARPSQSQTSLPLPLEEQRKSLDSNRSAFSAASASSASTFIKGPFLLPFWRWTSGGNLLGDTLYYHASNHACHPVWRHCTHKFYKFVTFNFDTSCIKSFLVCFIRPPPLYQQNKH